MFVPRSGEKKKNKKTATTFKTNGKNESLFSDQVWFKVSSKIHMSV